MTKGLNVDESVRGSTPCQHAASIAIVRRRRAASSR